MHYKKALLLPLLLISFACLAQDIPNSGFEDWIYYKGTYIATPKGWVTNDILTAKINPKYNGICTEKSSETHSGNYAVKMQVVIDHGDTANGCLYSVNNIDSIILLDKGRGNAGFSCTAHVTSFKGFYKFKSQLGDSAFFGVTLTKWNKKTRKRDILVNTIFTVGVNTPNYIPFVVPFNYMFPTEDPDTALVVIGIEGPHGQSAHVGTTFFIDDVGFDTNTTPMKKD